MANAWVAQQIEKMEPGISAGKTRRRKVASVKRFADEDELKSAVVAKGWKLAEVGSDYIIAPGDYTIRPII